MDQLKPGFLEHWVSAAELLEIPREYYSEVLVRKIHDASGKVDYPLAVVFNEGRSKRPSQGHGSTDCNLCKAINLAREDPRKNLFPEALEKNLIVTPNIFPTSPGATLFISETERPMYTTCEHDYLGKNGEFLAELINSINKKGLRLYHQTAGAGATITKHEHFHGSTFYRFQEQIGRVGFDNSDLKKVSEGVSIMPNFPFAHLVFTDNDPAKIIYSLKKMHETLPSPMTDGSIPHTLSQGYNGILLTPTKIDVGRSMGSERAPGYFCVGSKLDYESVTYQDAMRFMSERFFPKEIGLEKIL